MSETVGMPHIKRLFMALHGMYGNAVLTKFKTGELDAQGNDRGVMSTQAMWLNGLAQFDDATLKLAIARCADRHKTFPPTLPEFRDLCLAVRPRAIAPEAMRIGASEAVRSKAAEENRRALAAMRAKRAGDGRFEPGLPGLMAMVASAHGQAGGDEAAMLIRLETSMRA